MKLTIKLFPVLAAIMLSNGLLGSPRIPEAFVVSPIFSHSNSSAIVSIPATQPDGRKLSCLYELSLVQGQQGDSFSLQRNYSAKRLHNNFQAVEDSDRAIKETIGTTRLPLATRYEEVTKAKEWGIANVVLGSASAIIGTFLLPFMGPSSYILTFLVPSPFYMVTGVAFASSLLGMKMAYYESEHIAKDFLGNLKRYASSRSQLINPKVFVEQRAARLLGAALKKLDSSNFDYCPDL